MTVEIKKDYIKKEGGLQYI